MSADAASRVCEFVVKQIVDEHGGEVLIDSKPGEGTEFRIVLPVSRSTQDEAA